MDSSTSSSLNTNNIDPVSRTEQERSYVDLFVQQFKSRWEDTYNNKEGKELSLETFPFTPAERQSLRHLQRQGLFEGGLAGLACFVVLRGAPFIQYLNDKWFQFHPENMVEKTKGTAGAQSLTSPFVGQKKPILPTAIIKNPRYRWMDVATVLVDAVLVFGTARVVSMRFAPVGDPTLEAIVGMPGLTEVTSSGSENTHPPSAIIHRVCPLAVDLYQEMTTISKHDNLNTDNSSVDPTRRNQGEHHHRRRDGTPVLARNPPQTYHLDVLQRFVRNCQRRQRVEQTTAWQDRHVV
eukprot:scaffold2917_cov191-Amphora_coffeaeformis.AAC.6